MAAALARRGAALARRGMCSAPASAAAALSSEELMQMERDCSAHNYHPIPMVFSKGEGSHILDPEGNKYIDFLSAYSAVNQGHCNPYVLRALIEQAERLTLSSRAFYNDKFPIFAEYLTSMFGYEMMLPMNTGAEGVETAIKLARKWVYEKKNIPKNERWRTLLTGDDRTKLDSFTKEVEDWSNNFCRLSSHACNQIVTS